MKDQTLLTLAVAVAGFFIVKTVKEKLDARKLDQGIVSVITDNPDIF